MAKKGDTKPRGRMSSYAYFVQTAREEHKKKHPNQNVVFAEFSKQCADRWKKMGEKEKAKYQSMAEKDKQRYDNEMTSYVPSKEEKKGKKNKKDPNAPKRALSAFFWFCSDERSKVKASLGADSSVGDVAKELGKKWNSLNSTLKAKYEGLAAKDKARYAKEIASYKAKGGGGGGSGGKKTAKSKKQVESSEEESEEEEEEDDDDDDDDEDDD